VYLAVNLTLSWIARLVARRTASGRGGGKSRRAARVIAQLGGAGIAGAGTTDAETGHEQSGH